MEIEVVRKEVVRKEVVRKEVVRKEVGTLASGCQTANHEEQTVAGVLLVIRIL
jgi:hypothetical protein